MISLVKQSKFKVGVVPTDRQGFLLLKINIFVVIMEGGSLAMSAGAYRTIFGPIGASCMHKCILIVVV
jgi:hypothetical protein